ncbi:MAG: DUF502 domain-containing protein [Marinilabiliaceae bacterium]|nr:DUF502 domain-containing protein [Marinilabiliaceae bacterium]
MKKLGKYFLQGILYTMPIIVTIYIIATSFIWIDGLLSEMDWFSKGPISAYTFPGLGLLIILALMTLIGYIGQRLISIPIVSLIEHLFEKAPLIKLIYSSVKDLLSAFVGKERKFDHPVLVKLDQNHIIERLGFITSNDLSSIGVDNKIAVYLPSSYGLLGELVIVPKDNVKIIDAPSTDVMKFVVSGGVTKIK